MGIEIVNNKYVITVPTLAGYRTLAVNGVLIAAGLASAIWPRLVTPDPQAVGLLFDSVTGLVVAGVAVANVLLRLVTTTPVGQSAAAQIPEARVQSAPTIGFVPPSAPPAGDDWSRPSAMGYVPHRTAYMGDHLRAGDLPPESALRQPVSVSEALSDDARLNPKRVYLPATQSQAATSQEMPALGLLASITESKQAFRVFMLAFLFPVVLLGAVQMGGCAAVRDVTIVAEAETLEQRAFAVYATFTVVEERAASIVVDKRVSTAARKRVQQLDKIAKPAAEALRAAAQEMRSVRTNQAKGDAAELARALQYALVTMSPRIEALRIAVQDARTQ